MPWIWNYGSTGTVVKWLKCFKYLLRYDSSIVLTGAIGDRSKCLSIRVAVMRSPDIVSSSLSQHQTTLTITYRLVLNSHRGLQFPRISISRTHEHYANICQKPLFRLTSPTAVLSLNHVCHRQRYKQFHLRFPGIEAHHNSWTAIHIPKRSIAKLRRWHRFSRCDPGACQSQPMDRQPQGYWLKNTFGQEKRTLVSHSRQVYAKDLALY